MRKGLLLALLISWTSIWVAAQTCLPSGITFTSQQEIDDFASNYPDCTLIQGNVTIQETIPGNITSLVGLNQVVEIGGYLFINETAGLTDLTGLENLTGIFNNFSLYDNTGLTSLAGLESLTLIGSDFRLITNSALLSLTGLSALTNIGGEIHAANNENLNSLAALQNLTSVGDRIRINSNNALPDLTGLENLSYVGSDLELSDNAALVSIAQLQGLTQLGGHLTVSGLPIDNLTGLENLTQLNGNLLLSNLPELQNLDEIEGITSIGGSFTVNELSQVVRLFNSSALTSVGTTFQVANNGQLLNMEGLENLNSVGGFNVFLNPAMTTFIGLEGLINVEYLMTVLGNDNLQSLNGLNNLTTIGARVLITSNGALSDLTGLSSLSSIGTHLEIDNNDGLVNLNGMPQLTSIGGYVLIEKNAELLSLEGLEGITSISEKVEITLNGDLESLAGLDNLISVGGTLWLEQNNNLADISNLANLNSVRDIYVYDNPLLTNLHGLEGVTGMTGNLHISSNHILEDLTALANLTSIEGNLIISNSNMLTDLQGLEALETINGYCNITSNYNLVSLNGLNNLTSIGGSLLLTGFSLENLIALSNLTYLGGYFQVRLCDNLTSLEGTHNIDFTDTDELEIFFNPLLELCSQDNICNYILSGGAVTIYDNAPGCDSFNEILLGCFADQPHNSLVGRVLADTAPNCATDLGETGIPDWLVSVSSDDINYSVSTDSEGYYWLPVLQGDYTLNVTPASSFWTSCFMDTLIQFTSFGDSTTTDFFMQPQGDCPYIDWDVTIPPLRVCQTRTVTIDYCNDGALPAEDAVFTVMLDSLLTLDSASIDYTVNADGLLIFELPLIGLFECGQFTLDVFTDCDEAMIGDMPCIEVNLLSDALCAPDELWDGSLITARGHCENDSIYFELENIGTGNMSEPAQFRVEIVIDDIILMLEADDYQLPTGATQVLTYPVQGAGLRLEADQTPGHPIYTEVSAVVSNCEELGTDGLIMQLPIMDGDPFSGIFCAPAVNSYDPNIKTAIPAGVGPEHLIDKDWLLEYTVQFQNTGNDVAYEVVIADTLSEQLDLSTLDIKGASHSFTWALTPGRALTFTFADILLPDSTTNEQGSHGYVAFTIAPKTAILPGDQIENTAHIYFDFNDAIVTNTVLHTIRKPIIATSERLNWCAGDLYNGQIITQDTTWQWLTSYALYDSLHFVHLTVLPTAQEAVALELPAGSYFQDILLTVDTTFQFSYTAQNGCDSLVIYTVAVITGTETPAVFEHTHVYPNPTSDLLEVIHQPNALYQIWTLRNGLGQLLSQHHLQPYEKLSFLSLQQYPAGVYYLKVQTKEGIKTWKVVRE